MNGEVTLTNSPNDSQIIPIVKSGVKRGRKPKATLKESPKIETLNKRNSKQSENSVLLCKKPILESENFFDKSVTQRSPKGQGKSMKRNKIEDIDVEPVVNMTSSAESEGPKKEASVKKSRKGARKKQNNLEDNVSNQQEPKELKMS